MLQMPMTALAWAIILPLEIIYVICSMILTIKFLVVPLHLDGLLARWLSGHLIENTVTEKKENNKYNKYNCLLINKLYLLYLLLSFRVLDGFAP